MSIASQQQDPVQNAVQEILKRLAKRIGGTREPLLVVITGATVGLQETITELQNLILRGFPLQLVFSDMGEHLTGQTIRSGLEGYPHWELITHPHWFMDLRNSAGVVVPMLSVNALSKLALLIADTQTGNVMLHALFSGKPLFLASDGVAHNEGRCDLGFGSGNARLRQAVTDRLQTVQSFGASVVSLDKLTNQVDTFIASLADDNPSTAAEDAPKVIKPDIQRKTMSINKHVISGGDIRAAHIHKAALLCLPSALLTPLARELAGQLNVDIRRNGGLTTNDGGLTS